ncbi:MAG: hypothetical protein LBP35_06415 [Candidatus Ancillula trichonymphae]|nr:hypothetical protein [Candidatus Ancillula trichonymphae]
MPELERGPAGAYKVNLFGGQTSDPDIYTSGDCATVWHSIHEVDAYIALGSNATHHGILAGQNAATSLTNPPPPTKPHSRRATALLVQMRSVCLVKSLHQLVLRIKQL